jgi:pyridoxamine 5'-phosphate oxidase
MNPAELADLRKDYSLHTLDEGSVSADPYEQFSKWMEEAITAQVPEPTAMTLSTADGHGRPSSRVVLLKGYDERGFRFFTNYESRKGRELLNDPFCSLHFFWPELERQVNISGEATKVPREESENYFKSRPLASRIGAWASAQSTRLASREELEAKVREAEQRFADGDVPLPPYWGGFVVQPQALEFWQGRHSRLHDRICYEKAAVGWSIFRLSP